MDSAEVVEDKIKRSVARIIHLEERLKKTREENDLMKAELRKLQRVTAIDQSFNGPDQEKVG